jgi:hypothetical protein
MEMEHDMLTSKQLTNEYWAQEATIAVYILNSCLKNTTKNRVFEEAWTGSKNNVAHLRVFGYITYAHALDELRRKLDNEGQKCIFVGYSEETKGYNFYDPHTRKVIINPDV